ncbi:MAG: hypothetical protein IPG04_20425 [Polyangiaceae bacterium]|nr:hypothetical protein [Polyangiaceae bacterium]
MRGPLLCCLVLISACSNGSGPASGASDVELSPPPATTASASAPAARRDPPSRLDDFHLTTAPGTLMGQTCAPREGTVKSLDPDRCGTRGVIALEVAGSTPGAKPPCELRALEGSEHSGYARSACVEGDHLLLTSVCVMCRVPDQGVSYHARISELSPEQAAHLAQVAGLKEAPADAKGWRRLLR